MSIHDWKVSLLAYKTVLSPVSATMPFMHLCLPQALHWDFHHEESFNDFRSWEIMRMDWGNNVFEADGHLLLPHNSQSIYCRSRSHWFSGSALLWYYYKWLRWFHLISMGISVTVTLCLISFFSFCSFSKILCFSPCNSIGSPQTNLSLKYACIGHLSCQSWRWPKNMVICAQWLYKPKNKYWVKILG